jgi:hypothetical protein
MKDFCPEDGGVIFLQDAVTHLLNYAALLQIPEDGNVYNGPQTNQSLVMGNI